MHSDIICDRIRVRVCVKFIPCKRGSGVNHPHRNCHPRSPLLAAILNLNIYETGVRVYCGVRLYFWVLWGWGSVTRATRCENNCNWTERYHPLIRGSINSEAPHNKFDSVSPPLICVKYYYLPSWVFFMVYLWPVFASLKREKLVGGGCETVLNF